MNKTFKYWCIVYSNNYTAINKIERYYDSYSYTQLKNEIKTWNRVSKKNLKNKTNIDIDYFYFIDNDQNNYNLSLLEKCATPWLHILYSLYSLCFDNL